MSTLTRHIAREVKLLQKRRKAAYKLLKVLNNNIRDAVKTERLKDAEQHLKDAQQCITDLRSIDRQLSSLGWVPPIV